MTVTKKKCLIIACCKRIRHVYNSIKVINSGCENVTRTIIVSSTSRGARYFIEFDGNVKKCLSGAKQTNSAGYQKKKKELVSPQSSIGVNKRHTVKIVLKPLSLLNWELPVPLLCLTSLSAAVANVPSAHDRQTYIAKETNRKTD